MHPCWAEIPITSRCSTSRAPATCCSAPAVCDQRWPRARCRRWAWPRSPTSKAASAPGEPPVHRWPRRRSARATSPLHRPARPRPDKRWRFDRPEQRPGRPPGAAKNQPPNWVECAPPSSGASGLPVESADGVPAARWLSGEQAQEATRLQGCQGLITAAPAASKGPVSRVATVRPLATAMAAM